MGKNNEYLEISKQIVANIGGMEQHTVQPDSGSY